jgi:phosphatidylinositol glycan class T
MYTFNSVQRSLRIFPFLLLTWSLVSNPVLAYFEETFTLRPLDDQHVLAKFQFTTRTADTTTNNTIIQHLPRAISQLVEAFDVDELHLSFTRGTWMYERWGYGIGEDAAGSGAELWARLRNNGQR